MSGANIKYNIKSSEEQTMLVQKDQHRNRKNMKISHYHGRLDQSWFYTKKRTIINNEHYYVYYIYFIRLYIFVYQQELFEKKANNNLKMHIDFSKFPENFKWVPIRNKSKRLEYSYFRKFNHV